MNYNDENGLNPNLMIYTIFLLSYYGKAKNEVFVAKIMTCSQIQKVIDHLFFLTNAKTSSTKLISLVKIEKILHR
jgi:hypothetical protein